MILQVCVCFSFLCFFCILHAQTTDCCERFALALERERAREKERERRRHFKRTVTRFLAVCWRLRIYIIYIHLFDSSAVLQLIL
jgi:hypothetical protein